MSVMQSYTVGYSNFSPPMEQVSPPMEHISPPMEHISPPISHVSPPISHVSPPISHVSPPINHMSTPVQPQQPSCQSWFPTNPECPNHQVGVPFSSAYAHYNTAEGHANCPECFLNQTIRQSMNMPCQHLHATRDCSYCYPQYHHTSNTTTWGSPRWGSTPPPGAPHHNGKQPPWDCTFHNNHPQQNNISISGAQTNAERRPPSTHHDPWMKQEQYSPTNQQSQKSTQKNKSKSEDDLCQVCGDNASGYHYNALTCEGCKGFFRRSINKNELPVKCKYGGNCEMDLFTRRKCPDCRLKKCKAVGMLEECLLTEIQCRSKRRSKKNKRGDRFKTGAAKKRRTSSDVTKKEAATSVVQVDSRTNEVEDRLIEEVTAAFTEYRENPEILNSWRHYINQKPSERKTTLCDISTLHVQVLVAFTKKLKGFDRLSPEDQIAVVKGSVVPVMVLRNACAFKKHQGKVSYPEVIRRIDLPLKHINRMLEFFSKVHLLNIDYTEFALLISVIVFDPDHNHIQNADVIDQYREEHVLALISYCERQKQPQKCRVAKLLNVITELKTLYHVHAEMVLTWKEHHQLTPLLCEIWDEGSSLK